MMKSGFMAGVSILLAAFVAGCATNTGTNNGVDVTRFHLGQPIARAQIAVEPFNAADANRLDFAQVAAAVERQLAAQGFTIDRTDGRSEQVALVRLDQGSREAMAQGPSIGIGVGGGTGGWRSGVGGGIGINLPLSGGSREIVVSRLEVRIQRRSDQTVAWEGRAIAEARAGTPMADRTIVAERLANALFRDFPGESGRTIRIQ